MHCIFPRNGVQRNGITGFILKYTISRGFSDRTEEDYDDAAEAFRQTLSCASYIHDPSGGFNIRQTPASLLLMRARNSDKSAKGLHTQEAEALLNEVHAWAEQMGMPISCSRQKYRTRKAFSENCTVFSVDKTGTCLRSGVLQ